MSAATHTGGGDSPGPSSARYALDGLSDNFSSSSDMEWEDINGEQRRSSPQGKSEAKSKEEYQRGASESEGSERDRKM